MTAASYFQWYMPGLLSGNKPVQRLRSLAKALSHRAYSAEIGQVTAQDVSLLRSNIRDQVAQSRVADVDMVTDQLLFLMLGALNLQVRQPVQHEVRHQQTQLQQPWKLVEQSIANLLLPPRPSPLWLAGMPASLLALGVAISIWMAGFNGVAVSDHSHPSPLAGIDEVAPASLNLLAGVYYRMKDSDCQLPQAAMLPIAQRQPFLNFINSGTVDIANVELLKLSLTHVHCLYTKEQVPNP